MRFGVVPVERQQKVCTQRILGRTIACASRHTRNTFALATELGRVIIVGSVNGSVGYPGLSLYCATKFGLEGFADCLRCELAKFGVKVVLLRPGDYSRLTNIMAAHESHARAMWDAMSDDNRRLYGDYFNAYHKGVLESFGLTSARSFHASTLLADFDDALLVSVAHSAHFVRSLYPLSALPG